MADTKPTIDTNKQYVTHNPEAVLQLKKEIEDLFPPPQPSASTDANLANLIETLNISKSAKLQTYTTGDNFMRFCERFDQYTELVKMPAENQYAFFLQHVGDKTYSLLTSIQLTSTQKLDKTQFCQQFRNAIYGEDSFTLKSLVRDCVQKSDETISDYVYRLREKATIAYADNAVTAGENCLMAFLNGLKDPRIKRKLNETVVTSFQEAIKIANKLEQANQKFGESSNSVSEILTNQEAKSSYEYEYDGSTMSNRHSSRSPPRRHYNNSRTPSRTCWGCGEPTHFLANCPHLPHQWYGNTRINNSNTTAERSQQRSDHRRSFW